MWHSGEVFSYMTLLWLFPDMGVGIYANVNGHAFKRSSMDHLISSLYYISDHLLGLEPWLNQTTGCTFPEPWANKTATKSQDKEAPIDVDDIAVYSGLYINELLPTILIHDESSILHLTSNRMGGILQASSEKDRFLWDVTYPWEFAEYFFTDTNNESVYMNITFLRNDRTNAVNALVMGFEVNMTYIKSTANTNIRALMVLVVSVISSAYFTF